MLAATPPSAPDTGSPDTASSDDSSPSSDAVREGPRWFRTRIRLLGPLYAFSVPVVLWLLDVLVRATLSGRAQGWSSLVLRAFAAPGLLIVGFPLAKSSLYPLGVLLSIPLWLVVGYAAARVATRHPMATFREFWRAYAWLVAAVFVGVIAALIAATALLGRSLL